ncbi:hypothetical protein AA0616_0681 [Komagataeibacter nataicola NRIC 0616]|nr:Conserved uncharacterized protein [Komagataeibacter xylinus E25]GAN87559.1 hypothetical protein Gain_0071_011 [Komagataeibacter intermedius TF2]GBQ54961.1 hypothetical protein AA16373_0318 [Komagataeibacter swingsii DSM 16373]GBQ65947.1 hypothetical protein AA0521_0588 [Komagataeibacter intermedius NRIC 0521]GBR15974.1 hypothetical protein AA0616_0681 [Komagataeibacter nataicola NRIC 0616]
MVSMNNILTGKSSDRAQRELHLALAGLNRLRLTPCLPEEDGAAGLDLPRLLAEEAGFLRSLREQVAPIAAQAPREPAAFLAWFEELEQTGPGQHDSLFPWLAHDASREAMCWFLEQEAAGEAGFEDLTALVQVRMPTRPKLELARNYWDEMGHGREAGMHGPMLAHLVHALGLRSQSETTVWQSLALANTMSGLACRRHLAFHAVGALGVIELTAPGRAAMVAAGLKRLGVQPDDRHYFDLHAVLDVRHSATWNAEVISPLIAEDSRRAPAIAEGALMRLECGAACFRRYRDHLGLK